MTLDGTALSRCVLQMKERRKRSGVCDATGSGKRRRTTATNAAASTNAVTATDTGALEIDGIDWQRLEAMAFGCDSVAPTGVMPSDNVSQASVF